MNELTGEVAWWSASLLSIIPSLKSHPPTAVKEGDVSDGFPLEHRVQGAKDFMNIRLHPQSFKSLLSLPEVGIFHATSKLWEHTLVSFESARSVVNSVLQQQNGSHLLGTCLTPGSILPTACPRVQSIQLLSSGPMRGHDVSWHRSWFEEVRSALLSPGPPSLSRQQLLFPVAPRLFPQKHVQKKFFYGMNRASFKLRLCPEGKRHLPSIRHLHIVD